MLFFGEAALQVRSEDLKVMLCGLQHGLQSFLQSLNLLGDFLEVFLPQGFHGPCGIFLHTPFCEQRLLSLGH